MKGQIINDIVSGQTHIQLAKCDQQYHACYHASPHDQFTGRTEPAIQNTTCDDQAETQYHYRDMLAVEQFVFLTAHSSAPPMIYRISGTIHHIIYYLHCVINAFILNATYTRPYATYADFHTGFVCII
jgi:hypothetical protein